MTQIDRCEIFWTKLSWHRKV